MSRGRIVVVHLVAAVMILAAVTTVALVRFPSARADEEEEKPITSSSAQVSRDAAGNVLITIQLAAQKEIGIATVILKPTLRPIEIEAYGFILDPAPLSKLDSDLFSAEAALTASREQFRRSSRLYAEQKNVSLRDLQNAEASYLADKSRLEALQQQLRDQWGGEIARMDSRSRSELVSSLVDRRAACTRVTAPSGEQLVDAPGTAQIAVLGHEEQPLDARAVYNAPAVVPTLQGQTFLVLMATTEFPVRPGTALSARLPASGRSERGVIVPRSAVVRHGGKEWVYRDFDGERFVRHEIIPAEVISEGYFVTDDLAPGMRIVVAGAQALLSEELKSLIQVQG
jgi:membrane fusion protein, multidrug efflux system